MKRIAFLSPLPPEASGIADYSAELLPPLGRRFEIDCYAGGAGGRHYSAFPATNRLHPYDAVVYQLGNNAKYHWDIYRHLLQVPGIVVLHEYMLHHLIRGGSSQAEYIDTMRYCYGDAGVTAAHRLLEARDPQEEWAYPLFEQAVDASVGVIVHSETTRGRILLSRPAARVSVVPVPVPAVDTPRASVTALNTLRRELRIDSDAFVVGSFG